MAYFESGATHEAHTSPLDYATHRTFPRLRSSLEIFHDVCVSLCICFFLLIVNERRVEIVATRGMPFLSDSYVGHKWKLTAFSAIGRAEYSIM